MPPLGNLAIYHDNLPYSPGLMILGHIEADLAALAIKGPLAVTIRQPGERL